MDFRVTAFPVRITEHNRERPFVFLAPDLFPPVILYANNLTCSPVAAGSERAGSQGCRNYRQLNPPRQISVYLGRLHRSYLALSIDTANVAP